MKLVKLFGLVGSRQAGQILPMALVLLAAAVFIMVPALFSMQVGLGVNRDSANDIRAYYAAEAGITNTLWQFKQGSVPAFPITLTNINGMIVTVDQARSPVVSGTATTYTIRSVANLNGVAKSSIFVTINVVSTGIYAYKYAIASTGGNIQIDGTINSTPTNGLAKVFANGNLTVNGQVNGSGYYTGTAVGCNKISGSCQKQGALTFATLNESVYSAAALQGKTYNGNLLLKNTTATLGPSPANTYYSYINGNLTLNQANVTLTGIVWVNGYIDITTSSNVTGQSSSSQYYLLAMGTAAQGRYINVANNTALGGNINLISNHGYITVSNSADVGSIYAPDGTVTLSGNAKIVGAILGKSVSIGGSRIMNYPSSLQNTPFPGLTINEQTVTVTSFSNQ